MFIRVDPTFTQLVVANGADVDAITDVEVLDLTSAAPCFKPSPYPFNGHGAAGAFVDGAATVCGGSGTAEDKCEAYDTSRDVWTVLQEPFTLTEGARWLKMHST